MPGAFCCLRRENDMAKKKEKETVPVVSDTMIVDELGEEALEELSNNKGEE